MNTEKCSDHEFLLEQLENYQGGKNLAQRWLRGPTAWKDMLKNALRDIANWQTKRRSSYTKSQALALDDHHFKKEELESVGDLSKVCSQIVLKCLYLARIGRPDMLWSVNKLARSTTLQTCSHFLSNRKPSVMSKRASESTSKEGSAVAKTRPMNLVSWNLLSAKKTPPQDSSASNSRGLKNWIRIMLHPAAGN